MTDAFYDSFPLTSDYPIIFFFCKKLSVQKEYRMRSINITYARLNQCA